MEYISSDTNVWIDFSVIGRIELPFCLPYTYIMDADAIDDELLSPTGLRDELLRCGLVSVELTIEEFNLAEEFGPCLLLSHLRLYFFNKKIMKSSCRQGCASFKRHHY